MASKILRRGGWGALLVALFFLNLHRIHREPPLIHIGDIKPTMNFSKVRIRGLLKSDARRLRGGEVFYLVADETGTLALFLRDAPEGALPQAGCHIVATGHLSIGAGNQLRMRIRDAEHVVVQKTAPPSVVCGDVVEVWVPAPDSSAPHKLLLTTSGGELEVVHWFVPKQHVRVGDWVEVRGIFGFYKGRRQLKVRNPEDIRRQSEE